MPRRRAARPAPDREARRCALAPRLALALALGVLGPLGAPSDALADAGSRAQAIDQAMAASGGRGKVLGVREVSENGQTYYAVKVLTDGRVRVLRIRKRR